MNSSIKKEKKRKKKHQRGNFRIQQTKLDQKSLACKCTNLFTKLFRDDFCVISQPWIIMQWALQRTLHFKGCIHMDRIHFPNVTKSHFKMAVVIFSRLFYLFVCQFLDQDNRPYQIPQAIVKIKDVNIWQMKLVILVNTASLANLNHQWHQKIKEII